MERRVILLGDFNAHRPEWNLYSGERREVVGLEALIEEYDLILNNDPGKATKPTDGLQPQSST